MWLLVAILAVPLIEIGLFVVVGGVIGLWATLAWVIASGMIGLWVLRWQGMEGTADLRNGLRGVNPLSPLVHRVLILLAGVLLILPGFLTDALGLLLLLPPVRVLVIAVLANRVQMRAMPPRDAPQDSYKEAHRPDPGFIDAEFYEVGEDEAAQPPTRGKSGWTRH